MSKIKFFLGHAAVIHSREQLLAKCEENTSSKEVQEVTSQAKKPRKEQEEGSML